MPVAARKTAGLLAGALLFLLIVATDTPAAPSGETSGRPAAALAVAALMAVWWMTEALPIHWTACVPILAFPLFGVLPGGPLSSLRGALLPYANPYIFLFLGGMCLAAAMQQWSLHRRIALHVMRWIGGSPRRLLWGVLLATGLVSMWISNTATATMMMPIGLSLIDALESRSGGRRLAAYGAALMLGIAYASSIGGIATKIGTAPNAQLCGFLADREVEVSFLQFAAIGTGFAALFLPLCGLVLWCIGRKDAPADGVGPDVLDAEALRLGPVGPGERVVLGVFLATAAAWILGAPLAELLRSSAPGLAGSLGTAHVEGGAAMLAALVLLVWPVGGRRALELRSLRFVPFRTLLLLGGGFALAAGVQSSGLSRWMAESLGGLAGLAPFWQVLAASAATVLLSAFASNTATIAVMLPVLASATLPDHRTSVLFAATIASSCDFALPAGTPPNAIVFGSGYVTIPRMLRAGVLLDAAAAVLVALWCSLIVARVL